MAELVVCRWAGALMGKNEYIANRQTDGSTWGSARFLGKISAEGNEFSVKSPSVLFNSACRHNSAKKKEKMEKVKKK